MSKEKFLHLQHSESVVAQMAATIFSGFIQKNGYSASTEDELIELSVSIAGKLALRAEETVKSDQEWVKREAGSGFLAG
jgi:hypothetical protein